MFIAYSYKHQCQCYWKGESAFTWLWKSPRRMFVHSFCVLSRSTGNVMESKRSTKMHIPCFQHPCGRVDEKFRNRVTNNSGSFSFVFRSFNKFFFSFRVQLISFRSAFTQRKLYICSISE